MAQTFEQRRYQQYTCYTVFFISIEMCQIADVLIRKTRRLSLLQQGLFQYGPGGKGGLGSLWGSYGALRGACGALRGAWGGSKGSLWGLRVSVGL